MLLGALLALTMATPGQAQDKSDSDYFAGFKQRLDSIEGHVSVVNRLKYDPVALSVKALTGELGRRPDPKAAFNWVRDNIAFEPYEGHLRDTRAILMSRSGNSLDQALLLRELLEVANIKTRIAYGDLKATDRERLMMAYLGKASLKGSVPGNAPVYNPESDRRLLGEVTRHYWVEAKIGGKWVSMSPAFPRGVYGATPTRKEGEHDGVPKEAKVELTVKVHVATKDNRGGELLSITRPVQDMTYRNMVLTFEPADAGGASWRPELTVSGKAVQGRSFSWKMRSRIWVEFFFDRGGKVQKKVVRDLYLEGGALDLFSSEQQVFSMLVLPGWMNETFLKAVAKQELASLHQATSKMRGALKEEFHKTMRREEADARMREYLTGLLGGAGGLMGLTYANVSDRATLAMAQSFGVRAYFDEPRIIITGGIRKGDRLFWQIDLRRDAVRALPAAGLPMSMAHAFQSLRGRFVSQFEGSVVRSLTGRPLVTVGMIMTQASRQGIPIMTVSPGNVDDVLGSLTMSTVASNHLLDFVRTTGNLALVPTRQVKVEGNPVAAWWGIDPNTARLTAVREDGAYGSFSKGEVTGLKQKARQGNVRILIFDEVLTLLENLSGTVAALLQSEPNVCPVVCDARADLTLLPNLTCQEDGQSAKMNLEAEAQVCLAPSRGQDDILGIAVGCQEQVRPFLCGAALATTTLNGTFEVAYSSPPAGRVTGPWGAAELKGGNPEACGCK